METNIERREAILKLRAEGKTYGEIAKELNCNRSLIAFYCGKRFDPEKQKEKEESKAEYEKIVCAAIKKSTSISEACKMVGKQPTNTNYKFIEKIIKKYNLDISHFSQYYEERRNGAFVRYSDSEVYCINSAIQSTSALRKRLIKDGIKKAQCECCKNTQWMGHPIPLQVHHINGDNRDNRIENLQMLCPTCHALTDTYCGRAKKKKEEVKKEHFDNTPSKDDILLAFKRCKNFTKVGIYFGVTDNAVRKWCKKRELPVSTKEMKEFLKKNLDI